MNNLFLHIAFALALFLIVNWIGRLSQSQGYVSLGLTPSQDEAPSLNAAIRVLTPIVFILLMSAGLYGLDFDPWVDSIWLVAVYYVGFRWIFNLIWGRLRLLNWAKEIAFAMAIIGSSWFLYRFAISSRETLLPNPRDVSNELWLLVGLFLFHIFSRVGGDDAKTARRKRKYIERRARRLNDKYHHELSSTVENESVRAFSVAIMVYESFNRPLAARLLEYPLFMIGKAKTLGLMQVTTSELIDDRESVRRGINLVAEFWRKYQDEDWDASRMYGDQEYHAARYIAAHYNRDDDYVHEVLQIYPVVKRELYPDTSDRLALQESAVEC